MSQLPPRHGPPAIVRLPVVYSRNEIDFETAKQNAREDELRRGSQLRFDQGVIRSASVDPGRSKPVQTQSSGVGSATSSGLERSISSGGETFSNSNPNHFTGYQQFESPSHLRKPTPSHHHPHPPSSRPVLPRTTTSLHVPTFNPDFDHASTQLRQDHFQQQAQHEKQQFIQGHHFYSNDTYAFNEPPLHHGYSNEPGYYSVETSGSSPYSQAPNTPYSAISPIMSPPLPAEYAGAVFYNSPYPPPSSTLSRIEPYEQQQPSIETTTRPVKEKREIGVQADDETGALVYGSDGSPALSPDALNYFQQQAHYASFYPPPPPLQPHSFQHGEYTSPNEYGTRGGSAGTSHHPYDVGLKFDYTLSSPAKEYDNFPPRYYQPLAGQQRSQLYQQHHPHLGSHPHAPHRVNYPQINSPHRSIRFQSSPPPPMMFKSERQHPSPRTSSTGALSAPPTHQSGSPHPLSNPLHPLARGHLAQSNLHDAVYDRQPANQQRSMESRPVSSFPKPPPHSPFACWVGNVPSDASHAELWRFFCSRPPLSERRPSTDLSDSTPQSNLDLPGVDSVHLIARSNCAFVNYISNEHLQHAIKLTNGVSLRPHDYRCKDLVCRVRKGDEDKTGVGAQRTGGMHTAYIAEKRSLERANKGRQHQQQQSHHHQQQHEQQHQELTPKQYDEVGRSEGSSAETVAGSGEQPARPSLAEVPMGGPVGPVDSNGSMTTETQPVSFTSASTTSSFLGRHFPKRYFILKSHSEHDLELSVEKGVWSAQSHNEAILDQAFRTSTVFLIFGANKTGEWFGYAQMTGPIFPTDESTASSPIATEIPQNDCATTSLQGVTIPEGFRADFETSSRPKAISPLTSNLVQTPLNFSPLAPSSSSAIPNRKMSGLGGLGATMTSRSLDVKPSRSTSSSGDYFSSAAVKANLTKGASLDSQSLRAVEERLAKAQIGEVGPEERNALLEKLTTESGLKESNGVGCFKVNWIKVQRLPFSRTRHIHNSFNANKEVKISRDGTEVEPAAGEALLEEFWRMDQRRNGGERESSIPGPTPMEAYDGMRALKVSL